MLSSRVVLVRAGAACKGNAQQYVICLNPMESPGRRALQLTCKRTGRATSSPGRRATMGNPSVSVRMFSSRGGALRDSYYYNTTMRQEEDIPWEEVEQAAKDKIARHRRKGKNRVLLAGGEVVPGRKLRSSVVFEGIPRRRPVLLTGARPERMDFCDRIITEEFVPAGECRAIMNATENAVSSFLAEGPDLSLIPLQPATEDILGTFAYGLVLSVLHRMRTEVRGDYFLPQLYFAGALLSRLSAAGGTDDDPVPNTAYWNPHIDKANKKEYDYSAIVYLNAQAPSPSPVCFSGGSFVFLDSDVDRAVAPVAGRLLTFTSGFENPHMVEKVTGGHRFALSAWFTTNPKHAYPTDF